MAKGGWNRNVLAGKFWKNQLAGASRRYYRVPQRSLNRNLLEVRPFLLVHYAFSIVPSGRDGKSTHPRDTFPSSSMIQKDVGNSS